ncbi:MAG: DUF4249 domain-containing protein [Flavobacteriales bacterium]|nr:DUF4249 domain-containing protein [Flavobacteriales bacterium]
MRVFLYIVTTLILVSCQKEIEFKGDDAEIQMVLNGSIVAGENASIQVSMSKSILEDPTDYQPIENATVALLNLTDNTTESLTHTELGNYSTTNTLIEEGKEYQLSVEQSSFSSVSATQTIPYVTPIINVDTNTGTHFGEDYFDININFYDEPTTSNYYEVRLLSGFYSYKIDTTTWEVDSVLEYGSLWFNSFDPIFENKGRGGDKLLISDEVLTSSNYTLNISIEDYNRPVGGSITIMLNSVSEAYYQYFESADMQREKAFFSTSEGVPVYSNTSNGYGVLGSYNTDTKTIKIN